jgi:YT521-B-like domain
MLIGNLFSGAAGLANPPWKQKLRWPSTEAFALIWLLKQDVPHYTVRHLTNPLNENLPAHVGTDGVEIESRLGEQMYSILQNYARRGDDRR